MVNEATKDLATTFKIGRAILLVVAVFVFGHLKHKINAEIIREEEVEVEILQILTNVILTSILL
jgi:amino acid permease